MSYKNKRLNILMLIFILLTLSCNKTELTESEIDSVDSNYVVDSFSNPNHK